MSDDTEHAISTEVCEAELQRWWDAMDLVFDQSTWDNDDKKSFRSAHEIIIRAMQRGHLVIDEKGQPVYTPQSGNRTPVVFYEPTGASLMAMDQKKSGHDVGKGFMVAADMTKTSAQLFAKMANRDLKVCQAVIALFLG